MTEEKKLDKLTRDFSVLPEDKQDYIFGILQALVFAHENNRETVLIDSEQDSESA